MKKIPQFMIAAPTSAAGKTTVARGLMALLRSHGMSVQPYKCGPDYIDTKFHTQVCGRPSVNLDTFMADDEHVRKVYAHYAEGADVCVAEGMMGLFDGYDRDRGSSGEVSRVLGLPVVMVVDARSAAYSMAPLIAGFVHFRPDVRVCGVIYNKVGSERHYRMLQQVCDDLQVECLGWLPKQQALEQGSRYLGLDFSQQTGSNELVSLLERQVNWRRILELCSVEQPAAAPFFRPLATEDSQELNIWVARNDESFSFLYQEHIDLLAQMGRVTFFNPEEDTPVPADTDLMYLPGGYPEKHLEALAAAQKTRASIREHALRGGRIMAECGGMMYLCDRIMTDEGDYPMCGALPYSISARREDRKLSLGYRQLQLNGVPMRGHEFHYTQFANEAPRSAVQVYSAKGEPVSTPVFRQTGILASYTHLYWGGRSPEEILHLSSPIPPLR